MHRAAHRRVQQHAVPAAVQAACRVQQMFPPAALEHRLALLDLDQPEVDGRADARTRQFAGDDLREQLQAGQLAGRGGQGGRLAPGDGSARSEEHTSELQSLMRISYAVFCLKKKTT